MVRHTAVSSTGGVFSVAGLIFPLRQAIKEVQLIAYPFYSLVFIDVAEILG